MKLLYLILKNLKKDSNKYYLNIEKGKMIDNIFENIIEKSKDIAFNIKDNFIFDELEELNQKIKSNVLYIVVLGLFKRGKSSLINALLGREILPSAITPLTSIITFIDYGNSLSITVFFNDKTSKDITPNELIDYIGENENKNNEKNVNYVKVKINSDLLQNTTFIDTPGIGSTLEENTNRTINFIEKIDAAIFLLSADIPITKTEIEFLLKLKERVPKIIFLFNKIDLLNNSQLENILKYNKEIINKHFKTEETIIIPVSSKIALEGKLNNDDKLYNKSNFNVLLSTINQIQYNEKNKILKASNKVRLSSILKELESIINLHINSLLEPIDSLENKVKFLSKSLEVLNNPLDFEILLDGYIVKLQKYVEDEILGYKGKMINLFKDKILSNYANIIQKLKKIGVVNLEKELTYETINELDHIRKKIEDEVKNKFKSILIKYKDQSNSLLNELFNNLQLQNNFTFESLLSKFDLNVYSDFYYKFDFDFVPIIVKQSSFIKFMPEFLIRKIVLSKLIENFEIKIDANSGNLLYDINYKIQESYRKFKYDLKETMKNTIERLQKIIEDTINEKKSSETNIQSLKNLYLNMKKDTQSYISELNKIEFD